MSGMQAKKSPTMQAPIVASPITTSL
jgi:hypothetical protein